MPLELYSHIISPPSRAVLVTAKHLGLQLTVHNVDVFGGETRKPDFMALNPNHTIPVLKDGDLTLFESRAIQTYLVNQYAPKDCSLYPSDPKQRAQVDKMLYFDATGYYPALRAAFLPIVDRKEQPAQELLDALKEKINILEILLAEQKFFNGTEPTLADISIGVTVPSVKRLFPTLWTAKLEAWFVRAEQAIPALAEYNALRVAATQ